MRIKNKIALSLIFFIISGGMFSCTPMTETFIKKDKEYKGGPIDSVLIIGITQNAENRILFENTFSDLFKKQGATAYTSVNVFPPDQQLTRDSIKVKALELQVKAVILTHLISVSEEEAYQSASTVTTRNVHTTPMGSYIFEARMIDYPGYFKKYKTVRLRTNLYETASENLIFSSVSKTIDPKSAKNTIQSVCKAVIKDMKDNGLL